MENSEHTPAIRSATVSTIRISANPIKRSEEEGDPKGHLSSFILTN